MDFFEASYGTEDQSSGMLPLCCFSLFAGNTLKHQ